MQSWSELRVRAEDINRHFVARRIFKCKNNYAMSAQFHWASKRKKAEPALAEGQASQRLQRRSEFAATFDVYV